jgi:hypothetical protein
MGGTHGFAAATVLVSAGFLGAAIGHGRTQPGGLNALEWIGGFVLGGCPIVLEIGLIRARHLTNKRVHVSF